MTSLYGSSPSRGPTGTWPHWTPKPLEGDWAERPDTCYRWIEREGMRSYRSAFKLAHYRNSYRSLVHCVFSTKEQGGSLHSNLCLLVTLITDPEPVRAFTKELCGPLSPEGATFVSPARKRWVR